MVALMPLGIRIDVDNPFNWCQRFPKVLNYVSLHWTTKLNWKRFGYLKCARSFFTHLLTYNIPATWFFTVRTIPDKPFLAELTKNSHALAFHALHAQSWAHFSSELQQLTAHLGLKITGLSKHGFGDYNEQQCLAFAQKAELQYFIGNAQHPSLQPKQLGNIVYWPGCFWANPAYRNDSRYGICWLKQHIKDAHIVLLIHPENWYFNKAIQRIFNQVVEEIHEFFLPANHAQEVRK